MYACFEPDVNHALLPPPSATWVIDCRQALLGEHGRRRAHGRHGNSPSANAAVVCVSPNTATVEAASSPQGPRMIGSQPTALL